MLITTTTAVNPLGQTVDVGYFELDQDGYLTIPLSSIPTGLSNTFTFSIWIKSNGNGSVTYGDKVENTTSTWKKYDYVYDVTTSGIQLKFTSGKYYIYEGKLETGNKATDWFPTINEISMVGHTHPQYENQNAYTSITILDVPIEITTTNEDEETEEITTYSEIVYQDIVIMANNIMDNINISGTNVSIIPNVENKSINFTLTYDDIKSALGFDPKNIQADWNETDNTSDSFIQNKPSNATKSSDGFMSKEDKTKLDGAYTKPTTGVPKSDLSNDVQVSLGKADTALQSYTEKYTGTYSKPTNGIPKTDLESSVQTSLGKADTALQSYTEKYTGTYSKPTGGIPKSDLSSDVQTSLGKADSALQSHQDISGKQDKSTAVTHTASTAVGSATQPVYIASNGVATAISYSLAKSVPSDAKFTDTTYTNKDAALDGTDVSLVTTGEKYKWNNKRMTTIDPSGLGTLSMNRRVDSSIGEKSVALNFNNTASGDNSFACGRYNISSNVESFACGRDNTSSGVNSFVTGHNNNATSYYSFACGDSTLSDSWGTFSEGSHTTATNRYSHVSGHYNAIMTIGGDYNNTNGTAFVIGNGTSDSVLSNAFSVQFDGTVKAKSTITASTTADYAEFFEWIDGNPNNEDRVGYFVTLDDNKIRIATNEDDYILGVVSGEPFVLGNGDCDVWNGMYLHDEYRRTMYEPAPKIIEILDGEGKPTGEYEESKDEFYGTRPVLNPNYNPDMKYISRFDRKEWSPIGMLGVLPIRHDGSAKVNGYVTVNKDGIATSCNKNDENSYRVIHSNSDTVVEIIFR